MKMSRKDLTLTILSLILFLVVIGMHLVFFASAATDVTEIVAASPHAILIENPNNQTIYKNQLPLNLTVTWLTHDDANSISWQQLTSLNYRIDDKPSVTVLNKTAFNSPFKMSNAINISELPNGQHKIEVTARFVADVDNLFVPTYGFSSAPIYFTVYNIPPPVISNLSFENKTYDSVNQSLSFTINKQTSWMGYSLDGKENITVNGNTMLSGLSYGSHSIVVYANDTVGNVGSSNTIYFSVTKPFLTATLIAALIVLIAVISICLLIYFKKHKPVRTL
jgi:hypothetical protein